MLKTAVIVAGGSGKRMGTALPKQFLDLKGKPILIRTVQTFLAIEKSLIIALVLAEDHFHLWNKQAGIHIPKDQHQRIFLCTGGTSRAESVYSGLGGLAGQVIDHQQSLVAIHDGVRPFVSKESILESYHLAQTQGAAVVCVPVKASIRQKTNNHRTKAVDRSLFYEVQTPQTFMLSSILQAYQNRPHNKFTDDASLYEALVGDVRICEGSYENIKITTPEDIIVGERILERSGN